jgi:nucleotide-binding universal stress UspA family protein
MIIQDILIPIDGSEHAKTAVSYGIYLAGKINAILTGLHVVDIRLIRGPVLTDISGSIGIPSYEEFSPAIENSLDARADTILHDFRKRCEAAQVPAKIKKIMGIIDDIIIEEGQGRCDWILLAQRGEHFHMEGGAILGSTTQSVVRRSGKPVFVTPKEYREIRSMAIAYDNSAPAQKALNLAADLAKLTGWPLTVITIANDQEWGKETTRKAQEYLIPFGVENTAIVLPGSEEKELLHFTREGEVDMLIMGAYGHNIIRELVVGSLTSSLIKKSAIPILLTR